MKKAKAIRMPGRERPAASQSRVQAKRVSTITQPKPLDVVGSNQNLLAHTEAR